MHTYSHHQFNLLSEQSVANIWRKRAFANLRSDFRYVDRGVHASMGNLISSRSGGGYVVNPVIVVCSGVFDMYVFTTYTNSPSARTPTQYTNMLIPMINTGTSTTTRFPIH